jgi:hypothetical protein
LRGPLQKLELLKGSLLTQGFTEMIRLLTSTQQQCCLGGTFIKAPLQLNPMISPLDGRIMEFFIEVERYDKEKVSQL